jgi:phosphoglycolate phosphatase-like HAD superfamily hydrolase
MREVSNAEWDDIQDRLKEKDAEIERLKALLTRAADALEDLKGPGWKRELITELRQAAQS